MESLRQEAQTKMKTKILYVTEIKLSDKQRSKLKIILPPSIPKSVKKINLEFV